VAVRFDLSGALCKIKENSELDRKGPVWANEANALITKEIREMVDLAAIGRPCTLPREGPLWANKANDLTAKEIRQVVDLAAIGRPCVLPTFEPQRSAAHNPTVRSSRASTIFFFYQITHNGGGTSATHS
jgi:hypothetical protein